MKEQRSIAKWLNFSNLDYDSPYVLDFFRFSHRNASRILEECVKLAAESLSLFADTLAEMDCFRVISTDIYGTALDVLLDIGRDEFIALVREAYKEWTGHYPEEDEFDSPRWRRVAGRMQRQGTMSDKTLE